eukprot:scaffold260553_cov31-Attheya_sp.AAC.1
MQRDVTALPVESDVFKNMDAYLNTHYKELPTGTVTTNQIFFATLDTDAEFSTQTCDGETVKSTNLKKGQAINRAERIAAGLDAIPILPIPGIRPIKQVELWKKWGPNIPEDKRGDLCPKPPQEIIDLVKMDQKQKVRKTKKEVSKLGLDKKDALPQSKNDGSDNKDGSENNENSNVPVTKRRQQRCSMCGNPGRKNTCPCNNQASTAATVATVASENPVL